MEHRIILTVAISNWADGDCHGSLVVGGMFADGSPAELTLAVETGPVPVGGDLRQYARRALGALLGEL